MNHRRKRANMIKYKNELRIAAHARKGTVTPPDLNQTPGYESPLDKEIIICAGKCLKGQKLLTFFGPTTVLTVGRIFR